MEGEIVLILSARDSSAALTTAFIPQDHRLLAGKSCLSHFHDNCTVSTGLRTDKCSEIRWLGGNKSQGMHTRSRGRFRITDFYKDVSFQGRNRLSVKVWYKLSEVLRILKPL